jgi:hypothetical protein
VVPLAIASKQLIQLVNAPNNNNVGHIRDIPKSLPRLLEFNGTTHTKATLHAMVAYLLSDTLNRIVNPIEPIVAQKLTSLRDFAKKVYAWLVRYLAKQNNIDISTAVKFFWSNVLNEIRQKYMLLLEERAFKKYGLAIGRCEEMWGARCLLQRASERQKLMHPL